MNGTELVPVETQALAPANLFGTTDPKAIIDDATAKADALQKVLRDKRLARNISGREYIFVEGWTLLGTMLGVFPVVVWTHEIDGGWEARVEARTLDGRVVGAAEAQCARDENTWKNRSSYALRSMAQTRATSKALRGPLGFVVALAGFEATPGEEMDEPPAQNTQPQRQSAPRAPQRQPGGLSAWWGETRKLDWSPDAVIGVSQQMFDGKEPADLNDDEREKLLAKLMEQPANA